MREWTSTITGSVVRVSELFSGKKKSSDMLHFTLAVPFQVFDRDEGDYVDNGAYFIKVMCFGKTAREVDSLGLQGGHLVTVSGTMDKEKPYTAKDGEEREGNIFLRADQVAVNVLFGHIEQLSERKSGGAKAKKKVSRKKPEPTFDELEDDDLDFLEDDDDDFFDDDTSF